jgi:hypothetical protein
MMGRTERGGSSTEELITVKIKHGSQPADISLSLSPAETLKALKEKVKLELKCRDKFVRLICGGKLLEPDTATVSKLGIQEGAFIHAVVTSQSPQQSAHAPPPIAANSSTTPHRGFDRLTEIGLTLDEAAALRSSFQLQVDEFAEGCPQRAGEDPHLYRFRLEELWMQQQGPTSEFTLNLPRAAHPSSTSPRSSMSFSSLRSMAEASLTTDDNEESGTAREFLWGVLMGSTMGFLMIFCVWDRNVSQRQKLGIMVGISIHMFTGYLQNSTLPPSASAPHSSSLRQGHTALPLPHEVPVESGEAVDIALELPIGQ